MGSHRWAHETLVCPPIDQEQNSLSLKDSLFLNYKRGLSQSFPYNGPSLIIGQDLFFIKRKVASGAVNHGAPLHLTGGSLFL